MYLWDYGYIIKVNFYNSVKKDMKKKVTNEAVKHI